MDGALAAARARSPETDGRFLERDGRRRVHGKPAERRLQHGGHDDHGGERRTDREIHRDGAAAWRRHRADPDVPVSHRRDPEERGEASEVRKSAVTTLNAEHAETAESPAATNPESQIPTYFCTDASQLRTTVSVMAAVRSFLALI